MRSAVWCRSRVPCLPLLILALALPSPGCSPQPPPALRELSRLQLETEDAVEDLLAQAADLAEQERFDLASVIWQEAMNRGAGTMVTFPEWKEERDAIAYERYVGTPGEIEQRIVGLPEDALSAYRLKADGEVSALLSQAAEGDRRRVLADVATRQVYGAEVMDGDR